MIDLFKLWIEFDGSHLVHQVDDLCEIQEHEAEIPRERVGGTDHVPRPHRVQHEPC